MGKAVSRCVILSAGPLTDVNALRCRLRPDDVFIAADGGWRLEVALGVRPMAVVADFDSSVDAFVPFDTEIVRLPIRKDVTDTAAAVAYARERGYTEFLLLGCTGGRLDHQYAAVQLLVQLVRDGCVAIIADAVNTISAVTISPTVIEPLAGWSLSLFAFGGDVKGLTINNAAYELHCYDLSPEDSLCVSNAAEISPCTISFECGTLLIYRSKD